MSNLQVHVPYPSQFISTNAMDYSYFNSAPQPYQYYGMSPTPGVGQSMELDNLAHPHPQQQQPQPTQFENGFVEFQESFPYDPTPFIHPAVAAQSHIPSRAPSRALTHPTSVSPGIPSYENNPMSTTELTTSDGFFPQRSSSEEQENMNPQQSKRKAQNRAAQRAFRERKEKHLKDLETKLNHSQQQSMSLDSEVERLRKEIQRIATENEILRAATNSQPSLGEEEDEFGPLGYATTRFVLNKETAAKRAQMLGDMHTIIIDDVSGELLMNSTKTWDYIQGHQSFVDGVIDLGDVMDRLKKVARCDGQGPVFRESDIRKAISESAVAGGRDEL